MSNEQTQYRLAHIEDELLDKIILKLQEMRDESNKVISSTMHKDLSTDQEKAEVGDDIDLATKDREREFSLLMHERHLRRLQQIEEAFQRMRDGTYGLCEGTEEPINPKRLLIMPLARYSLEYQQEQEKMLGRAMGEGEYEDNVAFDSEE